MGWVEMMGKEISLQSHLVLVRLESTIQDHQEEVFGVGDNYRIKKRYFLYLYKIFYFIYYESMSEKTTTNPKKPDTKSTSNPKSSTPTFTYGKYLGLGVLVGAILIGGYFAYNAYITQPSTSNTQVAGVSQEQKATDTVTKLKKILFVEETKDAEGKDERPAVATIQDKEKVKQSNAEFYKYAENGDFLVIYKNRAIIYREGENKIINIAPIVNSTDTPGTTPQNPAEEVKK